MIIMRKIIMRKIITGGIIKMRKIIMRRRISMVRMIIIVNTLGLNPPILSSFFSGI